MVNVHAPVEGTIERQEGIMTGVRRILICFFGVFFSYLVYGFTQEKIAKTKFDGEQFKFFGFLVFIQCIMNATMAAVACRIMGIKLTMRPVNMYSMLSCSYMGSMLASNSSLAYISYPMQVLGKSCKPIPVLLLGVLIGRKKYHISKFFNVLLIVAGVALFMFIKKADKKTSESDLSFGLGEVLLLVSLTLDGVTGAIQDRLKSHVKITPYGMMFSVNIWSIFILGIGLLTFTNQCSDALGFISRHPEVIYNIIEFGVTSAIGQIFIYQTIAHFGPLTCSIITTTRKFFTILASVVIFGHSLILRQWMGVSLVFLGLSLDIYFSNRDRMSRKDESDSKMASSDDKRTLNHTK